MIRHLLVPALAAALCAGEAAPPPQATISIAIADGATLARHWDASLYSTVWNDPGMAWVRQQWAAQRAGLKTAQGLDLDGLLGSATGVRGEFLGMTAGAGPKPRIRAEADLGPQAAALFAVLARDARPDPVAVPGADQARSLGDGAVLARHGSRLVLGYNCDATPWPAGPVANDLQLRMDYRGFMGAIAAAIPGPERSGAIERMIHDMDGLMGRLSWDIDLVPQGLHELIAYDRPAVGGKPVDQAVLDRFPADALAVAGAGLDLAAIWKVAGPSWLDALDQALHRGQRAGPEATQREIDAVLAGLGIAGGVQQLVGDVSGTAALAITQGIPFPGFSLVVPRSPSVDALVAAGAARLEAQVPAEGASAVLPIPNLPIMVTLARDRSHWLLSTDAQLPEAWLSGKPGGFLGSPTGRAMLAKAGAPTYVLGGLDTTAALRVLTPYVAMGLQRGAQAELRQAVMAGLARLAREATPSWVVVRGDDAGGSRTEGQGVLGIGVAPVAIIAAIAIPNLLESRVAANEAAAGATLRSGVFPAQVQFQAGGYMDQDGDNVGEYGTLGELAGRQKTGKVEAGTIRLLAGPLAAGDTANGYRYRIFLPDGAGGAITSDDAPRAALPAASNAQERSFAVYAWPVSHETGRRMFALTADGQLRSRPWDGAEPAWNAALGNGWDGEPTWPADRGGRRRQRDDAPAPAADPKALF